MSRRSSLLSLSFMYFDKMVSCAGKMRREFSYIYILEIEFIQSKLTYMLSLQIQPSDTGCSIFILPSNAMNRDIQICLSNSTISSAHNSKEKLRINLKSDTVVVISAFILPSHHKRKVLHQIRRLSSPNKP